MKKLFSLCKDGKLEAFCGDEWSYIFAAVCAQINDVPFIVDRNRNMLSPNDLLYMSPMSVVGNLEASSHFKNITDFMGKAKQMDQLLQEEMLNTTKLQFERFKQLNHNGRLGINCEIAVGNIVGWRNSEERFNSGIVDEIQPSWESLHR